MRRFPTQKQMFAEADAGGDPGVVYASCDKPNQKGKKFFALFASHDDFAQTIQALPASERCFYEMIREDHLSNLYLDIEFVGPLEPEHGSMRVLLAELDARLRALPCAAEHETLGSAWRNCGGAMPSDGILLRHSELERLLRGASSLRPEDLEALTGVHLKPGHTVEVQGQFLQVQDTRPALRRHVSCSSRAVDGGLFKNSYHVVYPSVVFANNNSGAMQQTVAALCREWIVPEANGSAWRPAADDDADAVDVPGLAEILQTRALLTESEVVEFAPLPRNTVVETARGRFRQREGKDDGLVDILVYTKNRGMRTVFSHKAGSDVCFRKVPALCSPDIAALVDELDGSFITQIDRDAPWRLQALPVQLCTPAVFKKQQRIQRANDGPGNKRQKTRVTIASQLPLPPETVQRLLGPASPFARVFLESGTSRLEMDKVQVLPRTVADLLDRDLVKGLCTFYVERPKQCPWGFVTGSTRKHRSNNLHGVLCQEKTGKCRIYAKCLDEDCQRERRMLTVRNPKTNELPVWGETHEKLLQTYVDDPHTPVEATNAVKTLYAKPRVQREQILEASAQQKKLWTMFLADMFLALPGQLSPGD